MHSASIPLGRGCAWLTVASRSCVRCLLTRIQLVSSYSNVALCLGEIAVIELLGLAIDARSRCLSRFVSAIGPLVSNSGVGYVLRIVCVGILREIAFRARDCIPSLDPVNRFCIAFQFEVMFAPLACSAVATVGGPSVVTYGCRPVR